MTARIPRYTATELLDDLRRQGATAAPPNRQAGRDAAEDAAACRHLRCLVCGQRGLEWHSRWVGERYTPVCACPGCGDAVYA